MMNKNIKLLLSINYWQTFGFTLFAPLYAIFVVNEVGGSEFQVGLSYSVYGLTAGVLMIAMGRIEDHLKKHSNQIFILGSLLLALANFSYLFVTNFDQLIVVQIFYAFSVAVYIPVNKTLYAKYEDAGRESSEWALLDGGNFLVIGVASLIGGYLVSVFGFSVLFVVMGATQIIATCLGSLIKQPG